MTERERHIYLARVYLAQARNARAKGQTRFHAVLLRWAARRRLAASQPMLLTDAPHHQGELFQDDDTLIKKGKRDAPLPVARL